MAPGAASSAASMSSRSSAGASCRRMGLYGYSVVNAIEILNMAATFLVLA